MICSTRLPASEVRCKRGGIGQLNNRVYVALVLFRQKTARYPLAEETDPDSHDSENNKSNHRLSDHASGHVDIAFGCTAERVVEPVIKPT